MAMIINMVDNKTFESSFSTPKAIIFKNSMSCPISFAARQRFEKFAESCDEGIELYMVDVITNRDISNEIAKRTGITHESPQAILLKHGQPQWNRSHMEISVESLNEAVINS